MKNRIFALVALSLFMSFSILADDTNVQGIKLGDGDRVPALQPSLTQAVYNVKIPIKNCGSSAWIQGTLVVASALGIGCGATSGQTGDLTTWLGISDGAVPAGGLGYIINKGYAIALTSGTVNIGNTLVSVAAAPAGYLTGDSTPTTGADVGIALSTGTANGGTTLILLR